MVLIAEIKDANGQVLGVLTLTEKEFKTGSRGFYTQGKLELNGKRYQTQVQLVEIGSKKSE